MTDDLSSTTLAHFANYSITTSKISCIIGRAIEANVTTCTDAASTQCKASFWIYVICVPVLLVFGTTGNALTMLVMAKRSMGRTAFGTYILIIAISDTLVLWTCLPRHFIRWIWQIDLREFSPWSCRILRYLQFSLMHTSAWLLVTVTTERFLNIYYPTKFRMYKTRRRAAYVASCVAFFHFAWNAHIFWTLGEQRLDSCRVKQCGYPTAEFTFYWMRIHTWLDLVKLSLLPFVIMLGMNVAIIVSLRRRVSPSALQALRRYGRGHGVLRLRPLTNAASRNRGSPVARLRAQSGGEQGPSADTCSVPLPSSSADSTKTAMLLWVSLFYVTMTVPTFVATVLDQTNSGPPVLSSIATMAFYANNACNFVLYSLSGATFRRMFIATISRRRRSSSSSATTSSVQRSTIGLQSRLYSRTVRQHAPAADGAKGAVVGECNGHELSDCSDSGRITSGETESAEIAFRRDVLEVACSNQSASSCRME